MTRRNASHRCRGRGRLCKSTNWGELVKETETARIVADPQTRGEKLIVAYGKRTLERAAAILELVARGVDPTQAGETTGLDSSTLSDWRREDPEFEMLIRQARAITLSKAQLQIAQAGARDWRAAAHLLAKAPETREVWADRKSGADARIEVVVNVRRATDPALTTAPHIVDVTPVTAASDLDLIPGTC